MSVGKNIQTLRETAGYTQKELADLIGISNQRLNNWEKGVNMPNPDYIIKLCDALNVNADDLLGLNKTKVVNINQAKLLKVYDQLSKRSKDVVMRTAEDLLDIEQNKTTLILPMINQPKPKITEIDYYDQAAGMGTGQIVDYPMPEKIKLLSSQIPKDADFIIRVYGDSMEPTFHSNDKLFIHSTHVLDVGDIGVFSLNGEQLVKEYGRGKLISHNKEYEPIKIDENVYIQGKVVGKV